MFQRAGFRIMLVLSVVFSISLLQPASAAAQKFSAWAYAWTDSDIPLQFAGTFDPRSGRQRLPDDIEVNNPSQLQAWAIAYPGHTYIIGDEPDLGCVPAATYAATFRNYSQTVLAVDPTAKFANGGFGWGTPTDCPTAPTNTAYAQAFITAYVAAYGVAPPVAEWRFNMFPVNPANITNGTYQTAVSNAAAWSVANGKLMVLSFGFWEPAFVAMSSVQIEPYMRSLMYTFNTDWRIGGVAYWNYDVAALPLNGHGLATCSGNPCTLTYDGTVYDDYTMNQASPAQSGILQLGDFTGDGFADFADFAVSSGDFYIHRNLANGTFDTANWGTGFTGTAGLSGYDAIVADFTGDGKADFANIHIPTGQVWVQNNLGTGNGGPSFATGSWAYGAVRTGADWETLAGDIDGDGFADLVEHNLRNGLLYWKRNLVNGAFGSSSEGIGRTQVGPDWKTVIANFTGPSSSDRKADFADVYVPTARFWIHENQTFTPPGGAAMPVFSSPNWGDATATAGSNFQLLFGDFDGDGFADYADHDLTSGWFYIHRNNQNGTFYGPTQTWGAGQAAIGSAWEIFGSK
jgi:hypothetical protein